MGTDEWWHVLGSGDAIELHFEQCICGFLGGLQPLYIHRVWELSLIDWKGYFELLLYNHGTLIFLVYQWMSLGILLLIVQR